MKKNKFYMVQDKYNYEGICNIVIAKTAKEAKVIGAFGEATENAESWIDIEVKAIKSGAMFCTEREGKRIDFFVGGEGFLYTDKEAQLDSFWYEFIEELKSQNRFEVEEDEDND